MDPACLSEKKKVAEVLVESLPYIRRFAGRTVVIKYGGHAMVDESLKVNFAKDTVLLKFIGINPVVVHGGGPQINEVMDRMGIKANFVDGMRRTDEETMAVVEMVLGGRVNKSIVSLLEGQGGKAVGICGKDANLIQAKKMQIVHETLTGAPEIIDPGLVGEITRINTEIIDTLVQKSFIPVIAPIGNGPNGESFNVNADLAASHIAQALDAARLILMTDVDGLLDENKEVIPEISADEARVMIKDGRIFGGMIPKIEYAIKAVENGVGKAAIINGAKPHSIILELFTDLGIGTEVKI